MNTICWWSGGVTSAVAGKIAQELYSDCRFIMIDTMNEHPDTYRFKEDCEGWYRQEIEVIKNEKYNSIQEVWRKHKSLNVAHGAVCSSELKRATREKWQRENSFDRQVFGFEFEKKEFNRAMSMAMNHPQSKPIFPLLLKGYDKTKCIELMSEALIQPPMMYKLGFRNNNCFKTGCVQGGIGYWKKMKEDFPQKFNEMANMEHELTAIKGKPVTMLKDQSKNSTGFVFLKAHPDYPELKSIDDMKGRPVEPLMECNGFCGTNDLNGPSKTEGELNFMELL